MANTGPVAPLKAGTEELALIIAVPGVTEMSPALIHAYEGLPADVVQYCEQQRKLIAFNAVSLLALVAERLEPYGKFQAWNEACGNDHASVMRAIARNKARRGETEHAPGVEAVAKKRAAIVNRLDSWAVSWGLRSTLHHKNFDQLLRDGMLVNWLRRETSKDQEFRARVLALADLLHQGVATIVDDNVVEGGAPPRVDATP